MDFFAAEALDPDYGNRSGFSEAFLGVNVRLPGVPAELAEDVVAYDAGGRRETVLHYEHFSLAMSRSRKLALYTAVNLDGDRTINLGPRGRDKWIFDDRIPEEVQIGDFLYDGTPFDRGHLVRRLDPVWGDSPEEAAKADVDTFHFTNCSPQHEQFNRGKQLWQGIENYILDNADLFHLRVCVFNGPVLLPDDPLVKGVPIPREYWKLVTIRKSDGSLSATAYVLSQEELLKQMLAEAFVFGEYRTFQVPVTEIEQKTRLDFGDLRDHDPKHALGEAAADRRVELTGFADIAL